MPNPTLCPSLACPVRATCRRTPASGAVPDSVAQVFRHAGPEGCGDGVAVGVGERVLVCGGRAYSDWQAVDQVLFSVSLAKGIECVIQGGASGADFLTREFARRQGEHCMTFHADWEAHGRAAGPIRNAKMLKEGRPTLVIAFPGGRGTADMVRQARAAGVPVREVGVGGGEQ